MVVSKVALEAQISEGRLREENPLDSTDEFRQLCQACRLGDMGGCVEAIAAGANIDGRDEFDYSPLILASLCGHYEVVQLLLESGALCQRDTFQGERCLYNALNDRIRNLLLRYEYSKSTHPLQPFASHITSLLLRALPNTSDITLSSSTKSFPLHKLILAARSPFFKQKLAHAPEIKSWRLPDHIAPQAVDVAIRFLYLGEISADIGSGSASPAQEQEILTAVEQLSRQLEIPALWDTILEGDDRRIARQGRSDEIVKCRAQLDQWYRENVLEFKVVVDSSKASEVRWDCRNGIFADVLLQADEDPDQESEENLDEEFKRMVFMPSSLGTPSNPTDIPIGPRLRSSRSSSRLRPSTKSVLFPVHKAILIKSEFFLAMFSSSFKEAQPTDVLHIVPIDCSPRVLEAVLDFLYADRADFSSDVALDVLLAADLLLLDRLKAKAAVVISTMGSASEKTADVADSLPKVDRHADGGATDQSGEGLPINIYDVIRAGWLTRMRRLEEFGARFLASRLEDYIGQLEFAELIKESATRISQRQETDSIELLDDIRFYLSERFRLRFEETGLEELMEEETEPATPPAPNGPEETGSATTGPTTTASEEDARGAIDRGSISLSVKAAMPINSSAGCPLLTENGEMVEDEFARDALNYRMLLGKIDSLLEQLKLDA